MKNLSKKNCSVLIKQPFTVFEIKNFLPKERFEELKNNYPTEKYFDDNEKLYNRRTLSNSDKKFSNYLSSNSCWKEFITDLESQEFIENAYYFSLIPNIKVRGISALRKWTIKERNLITKIFRKVKWSFSFAIQKSNEKIFPHTDARSKFISMIYYLSDDNDKANCGTEFWRIKKNKLKWKNWNNIHIKNDIELKDFREDCEIFHKCEYEPNKLVGFIKSDISWHSVMDIGIKNTKLRKTFNLFIRS